MSNTIIYGIKNCSTMKKAFDFLDDHNAAYTFHDYKKQGVDDDVLRLAIKEFGWDQVINRRGMTWRQLDDATKKTMDEAAALQIAHEKPSIIKRPIIVHEGEVLLGFEEDALTRVFAL